MTTKRWQQHAVGYVQVGEVERLLEEAHQRGFETGKEAAIQEVKNVK